MTLRKHPPDAGNRTVIVEGRKVPPGLGARDDFTYSIIEVASSAKPGDRRGEVRRRTHLRDGVLAEGRGRVVGDCRIRDRSDVGAHLQLNSDKPLPKSFLLTDPASKTRFTAMLIWQRGYDAGVRLTPAP